MSILVDNQIIGAQRAGRIVIDPFDLSKVQPASYDVTLGPSLMVPIDDFEHDIHPGDPIDDLFEPFTAGSVSAADGFLLAPKSFVLAVTAERFKLEDDMVGRLEGKSSLARRGLGVHVTAGYIDPGFRGHITLELFNFSPWAINLMAGMPIAQMSFMYTQRRSTKPYGSKGLGSKYQDQGPEPTLSRYHQNFEGEL